MHLPVRGQPGPDQPFGVFKCIQAKLSHKALQALAGSALGVLEHSLQLLQGRLYCLKI